MNTVHFVLCYCGTGGPHVFLQKGQAKLYVHVLSITAGLHLLSRLMIETPMLRDQDITEVTDELSEHGLPEVLYSAPEDWGYIDAVLEDGLELHVDTGMNGMIAVVRLPPLKHITYH